MKSPELKLSVECGELHPMGSCPCCGELREHMEAATWFDVDGKACVILSCRWCGSTYFLDTLDGLSGKSPRAGSTNNMKTPTEQKETDQRLGASSPVLLGIISEIEGLVDWHADIDADIEDKSPKDMHAHCNGLVLKATKRMRDILPNVKIKDRERAPEPK